VEGRLADVAVWSRAPTTYERLVAARVDLDALSAAVELPLQVRVAEETPYGSHFNLR